jgi:hypothetical protein
MAYTMLNSAAGAHGAELLARLPELLVAAQRALACAELAS